MITNKFLKIITKKLYIPQVKLILDGSLKVKELFKNKKFILIFTFSVELLFNYLFEYQHIFGSYMYLDMALAPTFGLMFGPTGALGFALATFTGELIEGLPLSSMIIDFVSTFLISLLAYKLWYTILNKGKIEAPRFNSTYNIVKFLSIAIIISIVYFGFLVISFEYYPDLHFTYQINVDNFAWMLNIITFTIIYGLLLISCFNILKIPLVTPKKRISKININQYYLLVVLLICSFYFIFKEFFMKNKSIDDIFFIVTVATSILICINNFDATIEEGKGNYSIIEEIILIFLIIITLTIAVNFRYFNMVIIAYAPKLDPSYQFLIIFSFISVFILLISLIHIRYIEKMITNPLYDLIGIADNYFETENRIESIHKLDKYTKREDGIGTLVKSFVRLYNNLKTNLDQLQITTSEKEIFETEFDVASNMQSNMLPKDFDEFCENEPFEIRAYMNPAREVGGDFYDYFKIGEDNLYFVIGDVSGKGIPSTLFMVKTMHLIENHSKFNDDLSQIIEKVNRLAYERNNEELFVTTWLGKLNLKSGKLSYVNAGHNQPLIKHASDNFEYLDTRPNLVIGGMEETQYQEHEIDLNDGDMIFLYTDGITEANDNYDEFYGADRLKEIINKNKSEKLSDIIDEINRDIDKFCNKSEQFDDITMMVIKWQAGGK